MVIGHGVWVGRLIGCQSVAREILMPLASPLAGVAGWVGIVVAVKLGGANRIETLAALVGGGGVFLLIVWVVETRFLAGRGRWSTLRRAIEWPLGRTSTGAVGELR